MTSDRIGQGAEEADVARRDYVLAELRCARMRAQLAVLDIEAAGIALKNGIIGADDALEWLASSAALKYLIPTMPDAVPDHGIDLPTEEQKP